MEVGRQIQRPKTSLIKLLLQQVEEQSEVCDITVKVGQWEKKFHRCVLSASPFFENAINGNFLEKRRGIVEISAGSPKFVEMALMFLYGEEPYISIDTVGDLLEMAEFLMMKTLKYFCIRWLRNLDTTQENCMHKLQLSTLFGFEVTGCIKYIESHLSEVLQDKGAVHLSKDSIQYLFSDPRFSYVAMDEKLGFLVKWFSKHHEEREKHVNDLFKTIDLSQVSQAVWEDTKLDSLFSKVVDIEKVIRVPEDENSQINVLIMTSDDNDSFWCLDIVKKQWYRLQSNYFKDTNFFDVKCKDITGIKQISNCGSEIFFVSSSYFQLTTLNLEKNETNSYKLISSDNGRRNFFTNINVKGNTVFAYADVTSYKYMYIKKTNHPVSRQPLKPQRRKMSNVPSVLYQGNLSTENVQMTPILSLLDEQISKICIGYNSVALLLTSKQAVIIFDFIDYQVEKIDVAFEKSDEIVRYMDGFLIFNNKRCHCLSRLCGPSLSKKYLLEEVELENEDKSVRCIFASGIWLRLVRIDCSNDLILQSVSHRTLVAGQGSGGEDWKELRVSIPREIKGFWKQIIKTNLFLARLSRSKLRCHIVCPHCDARKPVSKTIKDVWPVPTFNVRQILNGLNIFSRNSDIQTPYYDTDSD